MARKALDDDRLFLSRLSENYKCRLGDNVQMECYVRHQRIKSIVWYAKGEPVDVRGVRAWYRYEPTTGQCVLYLRSVMFCDEGNKAWTIIPILLVAGRVVPGGVKQLKGDCKT